MRGLTVQDYPGKLTCARITNPTVHPSIPADLTLAAPAVMLTIKQALTRRVSCNLRVRADNFGLKEFFTCIRLKFSRVIRHSFEWARLLPTCTSAPSEAGSALLGSLLTTVRRSRRAASTLTAVSIHAQRAACSRVGPGALPPSTRLREKLMFNLQHFHLASQFQERLRANAG